MMISVVKYQTCYSPFSKHLPLLAGEWNFTWLMCKCVNVEDCFWLLSALLEYTSHNTTPHVFTSQGQTTLPHSNNMPERMEGTKIHNNNASIIWTKFYSNKSS